MAFGALFSDTFFDDTFGILVAGDYTDKHILGHHFDIVGWKGAYLNCNQFATAPNGSGCTPGSTAASAATHPCAAVSSQPDRPGGATLPSKASGVTTKLTSGIATAFAAGPASENWPNRSIVNGTRPSVTAAWVRCGNASPAEVQAALEASGAWRRETQPPGRSAGCVCTTLRCTCVPTTAR